MNTAGQLPAGQPGDPGPEVREQRKAPGRPFQAGDSRINRAGRPREGADPGEEPADTTSAGSIDVLAEMEALLARKKSEDRTDFQKKLRGQYEDDFDGYMDRLVRLRGKPAAKPQEGCPECARRKAEEEAPDEGTE